MVIFPCNGTRHRKEAKMEPGKNWRRCWKGPGKAHLDDPVVLCGCLWFPSRVGARW